jgi:hypothetical protein
MPRYPVLNACQKDKGAMNKKTVDGMLIALILLDVIYDVVIFPSPETWFRVIHGAPYVDPQGLLRRTAAGWAAFALWQFVALLRWKKGRHWLMLVAGIRWTEIFADWTYVYFCQSLTPIGRWGLLAAGPINLLTGWFFYRSYFKAAPPDSSRD